MASPRTLLAFYSMSGNTRAIANEIRDLVHAPIEEIAEPRSRRGVAGTLRGVLDAMLRREPPIRPAAHDPAQFDVLLLGGPVWAGRMAAPVRAYARRYGVRACQVAFFCTEGGHGAEKAFADLGKLCHMTPEATLVVDAAHRAPEAHRAELERFVALASKGNGDVVLTASRADERTPERPALWL